MRPLYQIAGELQGLFLTLEETEGELTGDAEAYLGSLTDSLETKLESIGRVIGELDREQDTLAAEAERLMSRAKKAKDRRDWLKGYVTRCLQAATLTTVKTEHYTFSLRRSQAVDVKWDELPEQYMKQKIETSADKRLIAEDLKAGATIPGARLVENFSLQIR
jgi:hypothetical protein